MPWINALKIGRKAEERIQRGLKLGVEVKLPPRSPHAFEGSDRDGRVGIKEAVETDFINLNALANVVDDESTEAVIQDGVQRRVLQPFGSFAGASHGRDGQLSAGAF